MARTRIYAKNVVFFVDGKEQQCDVTSLVLQKDSPPDNAAVDGTQTFCDLNSGSVDNVWVCNITAIQSGDVTDLSLYSAVWKLAENGGGDVAFIVKPLRQRHRHRRRAALQGHVHRRGGSVPAGRRGGPRGAWTWSDSYLVKDNVVTRDPVITRAAAPADPNTNN